jgi:hypothetical protein
MDASPCSVSIKISQLAVVARTDFYLPDFSDNGILIEVKPEQFIAELNIFSSDLDKSLIPWICVDQMSRSEWRILKANLAFWGGMDFHFPFPCKIDIECVRVDTDECFFGAEVLPTVRDCHGLSLIRQEAAEGASVAQLLTLLIF